MSGGIQIGSIADTRQADFHQITGEVGLVFQNPDEQIFATLAQDEVAFGPENRGISGDEVLLQVTDALANVGLPTAMHCRTDEMSGGQKQRLVIAAQLAVGHHILCLDEPFSQMDPQGAQSLCKALKHLARKRHKTIILVEHRIREVADLVDHVLIMEEGRMVLDMKAPDAFSDLSLFQRLGLSIPQSASLFERLGLKQRPLTAAKALPLLREKAASIPCQSFLSDRKTGGHVQQNRKKRNGMSIPAVEIFDLSFCYDCTKPLFNNLNLTVYSGERVAIMGPNGCGKTTLLLLIAGLLKPADGRIYYDNKVLKSKEALGRRVGFLLQNPDLMLIRDTVVKELQFPLANNRIPVTEFGERVESALRVMMISSLKHDYCFALSKGQRLRTAVASLLTLNPAVMLLDEPTTGQDRSHIRRMMAYFEEIGKTVVFSTHDLTTAVHHATRLLVMKKGRIHYDGAPRGYFTPSAFDPECALIPGEITMIARGLDIKAPVATVDDFMAVWNGIWKDRF